MSAEVDVAWRLIDRHVRCLSQGREIVEDGRRVFVGNNLEIGLLRCFVSHEHLLSVYWLAISSSATSAAARRRTGYISSPSSSAVGGGSALLISTRAANRFVSSAHAADACPMSGSRFDGTSLSNSHEQDASRAMISQAISAMRDTASSAAFGF